MRRAILLLSIFCFLFLLGMIVLSYFAYSNNIIQFAVELFTIPVILSVGFAFVFGLINVLKRKNEYQLILVLNSLTLLMIVFATIADYN